MERNVYYVKNKDGTIEVSINKPGLVVFLPPWTDLETL